MISRHRSGSRAASMSIDLTTSVTNTVTCLYSAGEYCTAFGAPHSKQNFAFGGSCVAHDAQSVITTLQPTP
jgi:hypothetical protein